MPNFFLGVVLFFLFFVVVYSAFHFSNFKPRPLHMGSAVFLNIGLTQTCIAIAVPPPLPSHGNLTKASRGRQGNSKLIVRNKVFECTNLLNLSKIEITEYGKWVSKWLEMHSQSQRFE